MLNIYSLIAATVLTGVAVASFAQASVATAKPVKHTAKKVKHSRTNKAVALFHVLVMLDQRSHAAE